MWKMNVDVISCVDRKDGTGDEEMRSEVKGHRRRKKRV